MTDPYLYTCTGTMYYVHVYDVPCTRYLYIVHVYTGSRATMSSTMLHIVHILQEVLYLSRKTRASLYMCMQKLCVRACVLYVKPSSHLGA